MAEQEIAVGQVWRRKKDGALIRIVRERTGPSGQRWDDWIWEPVDGGRGRACYGSYIRNRYEIVSSPTTETEEQK